MNQEKPDRKVSFFPMLLHDELLDSIVYRYHYLSGNSAPSVTIENLLGIFSLWPAVMFVRGSNYLLRKLPSDLFIDADDLLNKHSLLPAFRRIYDISMMPRLQAAYSGMIIKELFGFYRYRKHPKMKLESLQTCPICTLSDTNNFGVSYWRRTHQLNGVNVCFAHGCDLMEACPYCRRKLFESRSINLPTSICNGCGKELLPTYSYPKSVQRLAELARDALADTVVTTDLAQLAKVVLAATGDDTYAVCKEAELFYGKKYVYAAQTRDLAGQSDWLRDSFFNYAKYGGASERLLGFSTFSGLLMTVHILFGSWKNLDRAMGRNDKGSRSSRRQRL